MQRYFSNYTYHVIGEDEMKTEIMARGPIEVAYQVYSDFSVYQSGIYHHVSGSYGGGHAVKIIGWGEDGGTPYWIVANSWGVNWGENGFFRIIRGIDECGIESLGCVGFDPRVN
eukprot:gnl/Carplike_NY0171/5436_a7435_328.p1 GENE.gnl/Carplike_NY0171/5436_a7435_328~~gnl/Carplike_NY0171/5436_a7435_328.p1  ORF type:complete len:114 (+),score=15.35 gnl/Carplike_NY0171/5436_a7435_328:350-691(+)